MKRILASVAFVCALAASAVAELDFSAITARAEEQSAATSGRDHARYATLVRALARPDRPGLGDDFVKLHAAAHASRRLPEDVELAAAVDDAFDSGATALDATAADLVELASALDAEDDRGRCGRRGADGRRLAERAALERSAGRRGRSAEFARRSAMAYARGLALATRLLDRQNARPAVWSIPLHDLGGAVLSVFAESGPAPVVYAVGSDDGTGPLFLRMGGEGWVRVPVASAGTLWWVTRIGSTVFASGTDGRFVRYDPASGSVTDLSVGVEVTLYGIWGAAEDDLWTVGGNVDGSQPRSAIFHRDANGWSPVTLPPEVNNRTLFKVWGTSASDVWVCGQAGLILHYDGESWQVQPSATFESLFTINGGAPTIAVGGSVQPSIVELGAQGWSAATVPPATETLRGVVVPAHGDPFACGLNGTLLRRTSGQWRRVTGLPDASGKDFHAVTVDDAGGVYLAGGSLTGLNKGSLFYLGPRTLPTAILPQAKLRGRVQDVLYGACALTACHIGPFLSEDLDLSTAEATMANVSRASRQSPLLRILPGRPSQSYLWHKIEGTQTSVGGSGVRMPQGGPFLSPPDLDAIRAWILEGARDN